MLPCFRESCPLRLTLQKPLPPPAATAPSVLMGGFARYFTVYKAFSQILSSSVHTRGGAAKCCLTHALQGAWLGT